MMKSHSDVTASYPKSIYFKDEASALHHLSEQDIKPSNKQFSILAERTLKQKSFDALDYLMFEHKYKVKFI